MQLYYYPFLVIAALTVFLFVRYFVLKKKNVPVRLFAEALKNENSGHFAEALITYQNALDEVEKIRFHGNLKSKIVGKVKVLNTVIAYTHNNRFTR
jgi:hypothetical protein